MIWVNNGAHLHIDNTVFEKIVGFSHSSLIYSIDNKFGFVNLENSIVRDTIGEQTLIQLTYSHMLIKNTTFEGNYAKLNAHGLSLIQSDVEIRDSVFNNSRNILEVPLDLITTT